MLENDPTVYLSLLAGYHGMHPGEMAHFQGALKQAMVIAVRDDGSAYQILRGDSLTLDISPQATKRVLFGDTHIEIDLRIRTRAVTVNVPYEAVRSLFVPVADKINALNMDFPFLEADILSNGVAALSDAEPLPENVTAVRFGRQPQAQAAGAEVEPPKDQAPLDFSIKPEKKRATHLSLVK
jgi:stringent starvation protein B